MPGPEPGIYIITALKGEGGIIGVPNPTDPFKDVPIPTGPFKDMPQLQPFEDMPQSQPLVTLPHDSLQNKWEISNPGKGHGYILSCASSFYAYTVVQDDNSVIATNDQAQHAGWEISSFEYHWGPDVYGIHRRDSRGREIQAWTVDPKQTQSGITATDFDFFPGIRPPLPSPPQLFHFRRAA